MPEERHIRAETINADTVQARAFVVGDAKGQVRAFVGLGSEDTPMITLNNAFGETRIQLLLLDDASASFRILDCHGDCRLMLTVTEQETPGIALYDVGGNVRAMLDVMDEALGPLLRFKNSEGKGFLLMSGADGMPVVIQTDPAEAEPPEQGNDQPSSGA